VGDIILQYDPNAKQASGKFENFVRSVIRQGGWNCDIGKGPFTAQQLMRIKKRIESREKKSSKE